MTEVEIEQRLIDTGRMIVKAETKKPRLKRLLLQKKEVKLTFKQRLLKWLIKLL